MFELLVKWFNLVALVFKRKEEFVPIVTQPEKIQEAVEYVLDEVAVPEDITPAEVVVEAVAPVKKPRKPRAKKVTTNV